MNDKERIRTSKFLSLVLRHAPDRAGLSLDAQGWGDIETLLAGCRRAGHALTRADLDEVVASSEKQRFAISSDGQRIRANQGHSVEVLLGYEPKIPPAELYHGTADRFLDSISEHGLRKGARHHVHLSADRTTAEQVGQRHGRPVVLVIDTVAMLQAGHQFFLSENRVWLTDHVPREFLVFPT